MRTIVIILCIFVGTGKVFSQVSNTLQFDKKNGSPKAKLADVAWIEGHWRGEALGGITEEIWSPPLGNSMMCAFKLVVKGNVRFYELCTITEQDSTLILRLKHFHGNLQGWEDKDKTIDFPLVRYTTNTIYFDEFTFEKISPNEMNVYVVIEQKNGKKEEMRFIYKRVQNEQRTNSDTLTVITEKDLIPEGTAYDPVTRQVFIGSTYKRKIVAIREDGTYYDFVKEAEDDLWCVLGMEVDTTRKKLWAISGKSKFALPSRIPTALPEWQSKLSCYNLPSGKLEASYVLAVDSGKTAFLNDLTIAKDGSVYATESIGNVVYVLPHNSREIKKFLRFEGYNFLNGLTFSPDNSILFVAATEGILAVDMKTRLYKPLRADSLIRTNSCDGLAWYQNSLIGHQSKVVSRFYLNDRQDSVIRSEVLDDKNLNSSTSGEIGNGWYYYIANSQIRSGIDYSTMRIKSLDSLQNVIIKRKKL